MNRLEVLKTVFALAFVLVVGYLLFKIKLLLWIAVFLMAGSTFENKVIVVIAESWMKFASFLGNINSKVILAVIFYLVVTPLAFAYRFFHKRSVEYFKTNNKKSYFDDVPPSQGKAVFEKLW